MDFITIGEMLIDFLPGQEEGSYIRNAGGAPGNVAISAARNGLKAGMYCKVGNDDFGKFLLDTLRENHVTPLAPEMTDDAVTTMAFVSLNEYNDRSFTFARKPGADMLLSKSEIKDEDLKDCRLFQAGSLTLSAGPAVEATEYAMARAKELGCMVGFDINYRNLIWKDDKDACTRKVLSVLKYVDFLKLSDEEIDMVGGHDKVPDVMKEYDIAVAVLTLGGRGSAERGAASGGSPVWQCERFPVRTAEGRNFVPAHQRTGRTVPCGAQKLSRFRKQEGYYAYKFCRWLSAHWNSHRRYQQDCGVL